MKIKIRNRHRELIRMIKEKETRKLKERRRTKRGFWFGLGMFGLVGWSVVVPTFLGTLLGRWLDRIFPGTQSWTVTFLIIGLITGCMIAWLWLKKEGTEITKEEEKNE